MLCLWGLNCLGPDNRSGRFESLGLGVRSLLPVCCHGQVGALVHLGLCPLVFFFYPPWDAFMVPYLFIISTLVILLQGLVLLFPSSAWQPFCFLPYTSGCQLRSNQDFLGIDSAPLKCLCQLLTHHLSTTSFEWH